MRPKRLESLMISISKEHRDFLRKMAAEKNLKNPNKVISAALLAREIICNYLDALPESPTSISEQNGQILRF